LSSTTEVGFFIESAKVHGRGRVHIPKEVRKILELEDGDKLIFLKDVNGRVYIKKAEVLKPVKKPRKATYVVTG